jgi:signal transduction histidine kinase
MYRRLFLYLTASLLLSPITMALLAYMIRYVYYEVPLPNAVNHWIVDTYLSYHFWPLFFFGTIILMIIFYALLIIRMASYFKTINNAVQQLAHGQFDVEIPIKKNGGLDSLAENINSMKDRMKVIIEEEKRAVKSKNELVTNVSHDLRTPLTSMIGYLRLIEEDNYRDEVELRYFVHIAYEKSIRLNQMVNDLFEFTKINNHDLILKQIHFNIIELLQQLSTQFHPEIRKVGMELEIKSPSDKVMVYADPDKMMRVFENLISNAIKYGKDGKKIDLIVEEKGNETVIKVVNYGEPIPMNALPFIFDRLYRLEQSRSIETGGAGLGLAIAKGVVELHQGEIKADSNEENTVFQVKLPAK